MLKMFMLANIEAGENEILNIDGLALGFSEKKNVGIV